MRSRGQIWLWDEKQMWVEGAWGWNPRILWPAILPNRRRKTSKICRYFDKMQTGLVAVVAAVMVDRQKGFISLFPLLPGVLVSIWMSKHPRSCYMRKIKQVLKKMLRNSINGLNGTKSLWFDLIWFNLQVGVEQTGEEQNFLSLGRKTTNIMWYAEQRDNQPMSNSTDITWYGNPNTEYKYGNQNMEYEIWKSKCGIWNMEIQIWIMKYGNQNIPQNISNSSIRPKTFEENVNKPKYQTSWQSLGYFTNKVYKAHAHCIKS